MGSQLVHNKPAILEMDKNPAYQNPGETWGKNKIFDDDVGLPRGGLGNPRRQRLGVAVLGRRQVPDVVADGSDAVQTDGHVVLRPPGQVCEPR